MNATVTCDNPRQSGDSSYEPSCEPVSFLAEAGQGFDDFGSRPLVDSDVDFGGQPHVASDPGNYFSGTGSLPLYNSMIRAIRSSVRQFRRDHFVRESRRQQPIQADSIDR
jgi:hypothetical protein